MRVYTQRREYLRFLRASQTIKLRRSHIPFILRS